MSIDDPGQEKPELESPDRGRPSLRLRIRAVLHRRFRRSAATPGDSRRSWIPPTTRSSPRTLNGTITSWNARPSASSDTKRTRSSGSRSPCSCRKTGRRHGIHSRPDPAGRAGRSLRNRPGLEARREDPRLPVGVGHQRRLRPHGGRRQDRARHQRPERCRSGAGAVVREAQKGVQMRDIFISVAGHELRTPLNALKLQLYNLERAVTALPERGMVERAQGSRSAGIPGAGSWTWPEWRRAASRWLPRAWISSSSSGKSPRGWRRTPRPRALRSASPGPRDRRHVGPRRVGPGRDEPRCPMPSSSAGDSRSRSSSRPAQDLAGVRVRDRGIGVAPEDRERIFERFERGRLRAVVRRPGTGPVDRATDRLRPRRTHRSRGSRTRREPSSFSGCRRIREEFLRVLVVDDDAPSVDALRVSARSRRDIASTAPGTVGKRSRGCARRTATASSCSTS